MLAATGGAVGGEGTLFLLSTRLLQEAVAAHPGVFWRQLKQLQDQQVFSYAAKCHSTVLQSNTDLVSLCLQDIDPLSSLPKLTTLSISGNPVALKKEYRCGSSTQHATNTPHGCTSAWLPLPRCRTVHNCAAPFFASILQAYIVASFSMPVF